MTILDHLARLESHIEALRAETDPGFQPMARLEADIEELRTNLRIDFEVPSVAAFFRRLFSHHRYDVAPA